MLSRDSAGLGAAGEAPVVFKSALVVDLAGATNLAGTAYEIGVTSVLQDPAGVALRPEITPAARAERVNMLDPAELARVGLRLCELSEKWEALDLVPVLEPGRPDDHFLLVGNDNECIARRCRMSGEACDAGIDNDSRILVYRVTLPASRR